MTFDRVFIYSITVGTLYGLFFKTISFFRTHDTTVDGLTIYVRWFTFSFNWTAVGTAHTSAMAHRHRLSVVRYRLHFLALCRNWFSQLHNL